MAGSLAPVMYWAVHTSREIPVPGSDATNALDVAAVEPFEDLRTHRPRRALFTTVLVCLDNESSLVMWTPVVHISSFVLLTLRERFLSWHHTARSRIELQREVFSPSVLSLLMRFEGTMVLNAEL